MNSIIKYFWIPRIKNDPSNIISTHFVWDANAFQFDAKLYSHLKSFSAAPTFVTPKSLVLSAVRGNITKLWEIRSEAERKQERIAFINSKIFLKPIDLVKSSAQWSLFQRMTAEVSSARLERFSENDPFFKKWRSCRTVYSKNGF